jgi:hypothetical protein
VSCIAQPRRNGNHCGDPVESERLKPLFLGFVGKRTIGQVCKFYGLPYVTIATWLQSKQTLSDALQIKLRSELGIGAP